MAALICSHHLRNVDAGLAEGHVGLDAGEGGTGDVEGGEERTGTAGEIADAKAADGLGVGPV